MGGVFPGFCGGCEAEQPPRRTSAQPEARHVGCFCAAVGVPSFDPRPERKRGRGSKLGEMRAPVGRRLRAGVWSRVVSAFPLSVPPQPREVGAVAVAAGFDIADCDVKNQSSFEAVQAAEAGAV